MNEIVWHNRARKQMKKIPSHYREAIFNDLDLLATFPQTPSLDVKELKNHRFDYRLRVDAFAKSHRMAKQKFRPTRPGGFSGAQAYI